MDETRRKSTLSPTRTEASVPVVIERLAFGGMGVGHLPDGKVVFVEKTAPGDEGLIRVTKSKKSHAFAVMERLEKSSPERIEPRCPVADRCGGCSWAHLDLTAQRHWKQRLLHDEMARPRVNLDVSVLHPLVVASAFGHRVRCRLHRKSKHFGMLESQSHRAIPFRGCPVLDPRLEEFARELAKELEQFPPGEADFELYVDRDGNRGLHVHPQRGFSLQHPEKIRESLHLAAMVQAGVSVNENENWLAESSLERNLYFQPGVFVQIHREINQKLLAEAVKWFPEGDAFVELYAGAGNFTLHLAERYPAGMIAESNPASCEALHKNLSDCTQPLEIRQETDVSTAKILQERPPAPLLVADPPRSGMKALAGVFASAPPRRVLMVSCHPMAALRDMAMMVHEFGYTLKAVTPFDMFPQTHHLELLAVLDRE